MTSSIQEKVQRLVGCKKFPQKSLEWYQERFESITATDVAPILECNPYCKKIEILKKKINQDEQHSAFEELDDNEAIKWGNRYEPVAREIYEKMVGAKINEVGLIKHDKYEWLGASPDGLRDNGRLLEIKCVWRRKILANTPYYYWVQVQIQMEVCDLEVCDFLQCKFYQYADEKEYLDDVAVRQNVPHGILHTETGTEKKYWKLIEKSYESIRRDREWFARVLPYLKDFRKLVLRYRQLGIEKLQEEMDQNRKRNVSAITNAMTSNTATAKRIRSKMYFENWDDWLFPREIRNYILNDIIMDWLHLYGNQNGNGYKQDTNNGGGLNDYLQSKDCIFKDAIALNMRDRFGAYYVQVSDPCHIFSMERVQQTYELMQKKTPIIGKPVLHDRERRVVCQPDLIIRTDYLPSFVREKLKVDLKKTEPHYVVVDIRYLTLPIKVNGEIYNNPNITYYKGKLFLETMALNQYQTVKADYGFILGRKYKLNQGKDKGNVYYNNCFATLGIVNMNKDSTEGGNLSVKVTGALSWMRELKKDGSNWNVTPPSNDRLYPNMCNTYDYPWKNAKESIAQTNKELTLVYGIGVKERNAFLEKGITTWDDIDMNQLKVSEAKSKQITTIVQAQSVGQDQNQKMIPVKILMKDVDKKWREPFRSSEDIQFYVDFESVNDHHDDFNRIRNYTHQQPKLAQIYSGIVFLIGVGFINPTTNAWEFKSFVVDKIDCDNEMKILMEFIAYLSSVRDNFLVPENKKSHLYHWSNVEKSVFNRLVTKYQLSTPSYINWVDLMDFFKSVPIGIEGVFSYGLKNVAKKMHEHGLINTRWIDENQNGLSAMISATHCHAKQDEDIKLSQMSGLKKIITYNETDCQVMWDILSYLRNNILVTSSSTKN